MKLATMKASASHLLVALLVLQIVASKCRVCSQPQLLKQSGEPPSVFPANFLFGATASAYQGSTCFDGMHRSPLSDAPQIGYLPLDNNYLCDTTHEGAYKTDGKGLNNWDFATHKSPGPTIDGSNADVAADQYHRYSEDIDLMVSLGINSYRFSISWERILPKGKFGDVNMAGIDHYNKLINALLRKRIEPLVTMAHVAYPQKMEDRYGSWLSSESVEEFGYYADVCFKHFGDRVKYWVTFNEPNFIVFLTYQIGIFPPFRCSQPFGNCKQGNSEAEPLIAAKNFIMAHATAVDIYRRKYQKSQGGSIGYVTQSMWFEPFSNSTADKLAAERAQSFFMNWFLDPIMYGKYPSEMMSILGAALPGFSKEEQRKLNKSLDFIGVNYYFGVYVQDCLSRECKPGRGGSQIEGFYKQLPLGENDGIPIPNFYPQGLRDVLIYLGRRYNNTPIFITETGYGEFTTPNTSVEKLLNDVNRADAMAQSLDAVQAAMRDGVDVKGYFVWTLLDGFEWLFGYQAKYGIHHVDFSTLNRTPRLSAFRYKDFIAKHSRAKHQTF